MTGQDSIMRFPAGHGFRFGIGGPEFWELSVAGAPDETRMIISIATSCLGFLSDYPYHFGEGSDALTCWTWIRSLGSAAHSMEGDGWLARMLLATFPGPPLLVW
jgi:hypothetical protein